MTTTKITKENYSLGSGELNVKVTIGNGQLGSVSGMLNSKLIFMGSYVNTSIGNTDSLSGKVLYIDGSVKDVQGSNTDLTIITIEVFDDENSKTIVSKAEASQNGGTVIHDITISLQ